MLITHVEHFSSSLQSIDTFLEQTRPTSTTTTTPKNNHGHDNDSTVSSSSSSSSGTDDNDKCVICDNVGELLICDGCERSYHLQCLDPPLELENVPDGDWFCPQCSSHDDGNNNNTATAATATAAAGAATATTTPGSDVDVATMMEQETTMTMKNIDGLVPMPKVRKSPYDGIKCAELEDAWFTEIKKTVLGISNPTSTSTSYADAVHKRVTLQNARLEIKNSGILFSVNWLEGWIRGKNFSTILSAPKMGDDESLLLLSLYEHRFSKGDDIVLKSIIFNLHCFELVIKVCVTYI